MINSTADFRDIINNGKPMFGRIVCFLADGTKKTFEKDDFLMSSKGFSITSSSSSTSTFDIASVNASSLEVQLINYDGYLDNYDFDGARIQAYVGAELSTGLEEIINKGIFYVDSQDFNSGLVTLTCYDAVAQLDCQYTGERSGTAQLLVTAIANKHGLTLSNSHFNNYNYILTLTDEQNVNYTDREMLRCICEVTCNYAYINPDGYLTLEWYNDTANINTISAGRFNEPSSDIIEAGNISDINNAKLLYSGGTFTEANSETKIINNVMSVSNVGIADVEITGIEVSYGNNKTAKAGSDGYVLAVKNNPFVNENNAQNIADNIWSIAQNTRFRTMTIRTLCNPLLEIGDLVVIEVGKNLYQTIITNISFAIGQLTILTTGAASARKNASYSNGVNSTERKLQAIASNSASGLANQFANLITQSLGMYEIRENRPNGGEILYLSNKPTLEESYGGTVWRMDLNIFTVTKNYQGDSTVWQAGFDSDGNAIMNVLDVVGISFNWAKGGTLSLGGVDNTNGLLKVYDSQGNIIGTWGTDGINATNVKLTGQIISKGQGVDSAGTIYDMTASLLGGELKIKSNTGAYLYIQGHTISLSDETGAEEVATLGRHYSHFGTENNRMSVWFYCDANEKPVAITSEGGAYYGRCGLSLIGTQKVSQDMYVYGSIYGSMASDSDRHVKKDIKALDIDNSAQFIYSLIPSEFRFIHGTSNRLHHGFIAQEVKDTMGGNDWGVFIDKSIQNDKYEETIYSEDGSSEKILTAKYGLRYDEFIADIVATLQSQNERIKTLERQIEELSKSEEV